jgi:hypothetical protein
MNSPSALHTGAEKKGYLHVSVDFNHALSSQTEVCDDQPFAGFTQPAEQSAESHAAKELRVVSTPLRGDEILRQAVLLTLCDSSPQNCMWLHALSPGQWRRLLRWLDLSGLALYFLDRLVELQATGSLPAPILASLQQRLSDNTERTHSMIAESIAIQVEFQKAGLWYALLKGLSLWPGSVQKPELRSQFDLDFLVAEEDLPEARKILECRGYRLYGANGRSWEFKRNEKPGITLKDLYKDVGSWRVELHAQPADSTHTSQLDRLEWRKLCGFAMPVLSPVDLFLGQGLHACKHILSEFVRVSNLIEFRRHVLFCGDDEAFWCDVRRRAGENSHAAVGLGVTILLITQTMGEFAPEGLTSWTVDRLPLSARRWVERYGHRAVLGDYPGSKLYLLLQGELENASRQEKRSLRQSLIPLSLPPPIIRAIPDEPFAVRFRRYRMQLQLIFSRARFHLIEGLRFAWESYRWRRLLDQVSR